MTISRNKFVSLTYDLHIGGFDGELQEQAVEATPLTFIFGAGMMLPKFEEYLEGLKVGDSYKFSITANEGYGEFYEDRVVNLPMSVFSLEGQPIEDGLLEVGNVLPMMDSEGNRLHGTIKAIGEEVTMDFNHPMAGKDLYFTGNVLEVREATEQEILDASGAGGCSGGSCGSCEDTDQQSCGGSCNC